MEVPDGTIEVISTFVKEFVNGRDVILGISGGIDSTMVGYFLTKNIPREKVHLYSLPYKNEDQDVPKVEEFLGIKIERIFIDDFVKPFTNLVSDKKSLGNVMARIRMVILYSMANKYNGLVAGTSNKSEILTGYFTKFGDGASDFQPIGDLYKTQVYELARKLNFPEWILNKKPTANLWEGQTDEDELGIKYSDLDRILQCIEFFKSKDECQVKTGFDMKLINRVYEMVENSKHKRIILYIPKINFRSVGTDWLE